CTSAVNGDVDARYLSDVPGIWGTLWFYTYIDPNTVCITISQGWLIVATGRQRSGGYIMAGEDNAAINH
ncbi:hypothetical protein J1N35_040914, partial [Gossypium stocksii]